MAAPAASVEPFRRLVRLVARAFYDDVTMKGDNQPTKSGGARGDNRGMAVVVLDALTRREWVREEDLAKALKLHSKQLRRILRFFEEEKLVMRDHRKESAKGAKVYSAAVAATGDNHQAGKEGEEKIKMHTHSYCCLDYAQIYDVVRYRLHRMKKRIKDELESKNTIQQYICPNCGRRYSAFDALQLVSFTDEYFHCENCNGELVAESDKLVVEEMGDGDDNARMRKREKLNDTLRKMEDQLEPLAKQILRVKDMTVPEFGTLQAWEARANASARVNGESIASDPNKSGQGSALGGTPMPFLGETKVEVAFSGVQDKDAGTESDVKSTEQKVVPPWLIKEGMNLTKEQRGETSGPSEGENTEAKDEKKQWDDLEDDERSRHDAYLKAYYAAMMEREKEKEQMKGLLDQNGGASTAGNPSTLSGSSVLRSVGGKSKREDDNDDVEWDEDQPAANHSGETYKLADLNVEAQASPSGEDDIDWEDG